MLRPTHHKFCTVCGAALSEGSCPTCDLGQASAAENLTFFKASFLLYFTLLATFVPFAFNKELIALEIIISIVDAVIILTFCFRFWRSLKPLLVLPRWYWWGIAVAAAGLIFAVNTLYFKFIVQYLNVPYAGVHVDAYQEFGLDWWAIIAIVCLQPGIFEELAFRGLIFDGLAKHLSYRETWILSVFMFALLHLSLWSFPALFFVGWGLIVLRQKSGSLFPGMLLHAVYNLFCTIGDVHFPLN